jgi:hypothetical protein
MYRVKYLILLLSIVFTANAIAASKGVAKVIKARGKVYDVASKKKLKKGDWIKEGAKILTKNRSFVKLLFIDKSKMSLGPNSKMVVTKFPKKKAGIISLMKGQLRSQVTKNYMEMSDKEKSKLFIRTKTAAMGVRGTDFQVNYNPKNQNTSLVTFEGAVAMGAIGDIRKGLNQARLERIVSSPTAVMVRRGQFSGVMPSVDTKPLAPIKINKKQLKAMEKNDGSVTKKNSPKKKKAKKLAKRNILPPGISSAEFAGTSKKDLAKEFEKVDLKTANIIKNEAEDIKKGPANEPVGNFEENTSLKEGGLIDTSNVLYIPPPKDAAIDPVTKEYIIPEKLGSFDYNTGEYQNDYYELKHTGDFVAKEPEPEDGRFPASNEPLPPPPSNVVDQMQEYANYDPAYYDDPNAGADGTLIDDVIENRDDQIQEQQENLQQQRTKVRFIFNNTP